jgi:hypothetical protein
VGAEHFAEAAKLYLALELVAKGEGSVRRLVVHHLQGVYGSKGWV